MLARYARFKDLSVRALLCLLVVPANASGQTPQTQAPREKDEIVRVYTALVQTDVMVFDKQGRFVNGLRPENFELRIDGKVRPIESFEQITAGSNEEAQLAAARGAILNSASDKSKRSTPLDRGRTVFFYVDDLHLDLPGINAAKKLINNFIDKEMGQNDEVAIVSSTGQIGFLQQLTDNKLVLRTALKRLNTRQNQSVDRDRPTMTEYQALQISRNDFDTMGYFIDETSKLNPGLPRDLVGQIVTARADTILAQTSQITTNTLTGLNGLVRSVKPLAGRKVLFFLSNGFLIDNRHSNFAGNLQQITSGAAKAGVVIYSMDMRGLVAPFADAANDTGFDPSGRLQRSSSGELSASQDGLNALARVVFATSS